MAVGVSVFLLSRVNSDVSKTKSVEDYWTETGLGPVVLDELIQDATCKSSERYFLACVNSLITMANRFDLTLSNEGRLTQISEKNFNDLTSEKKQLEPWRQFYSEQPEMAAKISFASAWAEIRQKYIKGSSSAMVVGLGLNGFISVFRDPHTYFMPVAQFKDIFSKVDSRMATLGLVIGVSKGNYIVRRVVEGSPAQVAGVRKGDMLVSINGRKLRGLIHNRVVELLKNNVVGHAIDLAVARNGEKIGFSLSPRESNIGQVKVTIVNGIKPIAVIGLNRFIGSTCQKVKESLKYAESHHVRGILLDLRDNSGGLMEQAACVASLFVGPKKKIFEVRYLDSEKSPAEYFGEEEQLTKLPMAVLVNGYSASAAEIVAGSLRDLKRAVLVGERTFGKGSFQEGEFWEQNKKIAILETKGFYYLPSGISPQLIGLEPDVPVAFDDISTARETDQFINPLRAPASFSHASLEQYSFDHCLQGEEATAVDDIQLSKAREILFCSNLIATAN